MTKSPAITGDYRCLAKSNATPLSPYQAQALVEQLRQQQAELAQVPLPPVAATPTPIPEDEPVDIAAEEAGVDAPLTAEADAEVPETEEQEAAAAEPPFETPTASRKRRESITKNAEQVTRRVAQAKSSLATRWQPPNCADFCGTCMQRRPLQLRDAHKYILAKSDHACVIQRVALSHATSAFRPDVFG